LIRLRYPGRLSHPSSSGSSPSGPTILIALAPNAGGGGISISFDSPISAFSIDLIDPLDGAAIDAFFSLSNSNGGSQALLTGEQGNNEVHFFGVVDTLQAFSTDTLFSTKPQDALHIDRIQYSPVPIPAAVWLFGSGLLGLIEFARRLSDKISKGHPEGWPVHVIAQEG
jgi:hypothetical protein